VWQGSKRPECHSFRCHSKYTTLLSLHLPLPQAFVCGRAASGLSCTLVGVITKATTHHTNSIHMFCYAPTALLRAFVCGRAASGLSCILVRIITKATTHHTTSVHMCCYAHPALLQASVCGRAASGLNITPLRCHSKNY
jgi:hypothetical protein